jgi:acetyl-CoA acetyltransferase
LSSARRAVVAGVYTTEQRRETGRSELSLALEALKGSLADAGMERTDIEGLYAMMNRWPAQPPGLSWYPQFSTWAAQLGIPIRWFTGGVNAAHTGAPAILDAKAAIEAGQIDTAAIVLGGAHPPKTDDRTAVWTRHAHEFTGWTGSYTAVQFSLVARRHMIEYGTTPEQLATPAAIIRGFGNRNPDAVMYRRGPTSVSDVLGSRPIADPLTLLMCAQVNDGGGAMIITTAERARDLPKPAVRILGGADQLSYPAYAEVPLLQHHHGHPFPTDWVDGGFARAGVGREDLDFLELYDGFSIWVLTQLEMLGLCKPGEGGPFAQSGALALGGRYPTCTDGGCMSFSHNGTPSLFRPIEAVRQLRDEVIDDCPGSASGEHTYDVQLCRKVRDPSIGLAMTMGPPTGGGSFVILARD